MDRFNEDMAHGYLETGEPLDALYGAGLFANQQPDLPPVIQCYVCGGTAYDLGTECENCGRIPAKVAS